MVGPAFASKLPSAFNHRSGANCLAVPAFQNPTRRPLAVSCRLSSSDAVDSIALLDPQVALSSSSYWNDAEVMRIVPLGMA